MRQEQPSPEGREALERANIDPALVTGARMCLYERGEYLCVQGRPIERLLILLSGSAKVTQSSRSGGVLLLCFYDGGGMMGDLELMLGQTEATSSVQATSAVKCVGLPIAPNRELLLSDTDFLRGAATALARKLERQTGNSARNILCPLSERLCAYIDGTAVEGVFSERLTESAELLGTSYRHLLRSLAALCSRGVLRRTGAGYVILDREALRREGGGFYRPAETGIM